MQFPGVPHATARRLAVWPVLAAFPGSGDSAGIQVPFTISSTRPWVVLAFLPRKYSPTATHEPGVAHETAQSVVPFAPGAPPGGGASAGVQVPWLKVSMSPRDSPLAS